MSGQDKSARRWQKMRADSIFAAVNSLPVDPEVSDVLARAEVFLEYISNGDRLTALSVADEASRAGLTIEERRRERAQRIEEQRQAGDRSAAEVVAELSALPPLALDTVDGETTRERLERERAQRIEEQRHRFDAEGPAPTSASAAWQGEGVADERREMTSSGASESASMKNYVVNIVRGTRLTRSDAEEIVTMVRSRAVL